MSETREHDDIVGPVVFTEARNPEDRWVSTGYRQVRGPPIVAGAALQYIEDAIEGEWGVGTLDDPPGSDALSRAAIVGFASFLEDTGVPAYVNLATELRGE